MLSDTESNSVLLDSSTFPILKVRHEKGLKSERCVISGIGLD